MADQIRHWFEWSNLYLQMPLGVVGFVIAIWQIVRAKRAANAAAEAAGNALAQFKLVSVTSLLPQLIRLDEAVDRAIEIKSTHLLSHVLLSWTWQAGMCREFLDRKIAEEADTMTKIQGSITAAVALKQELLLFKKDTDWVGKTEFFRETIAAVTGDLGSLAGRQQVRERNSG